MQPEHCTDIRLTAQLELAQPPELLDPAKNFLDATAGIDRLGVALTVTFRKDVAGWRLFRPPAERVTPPSLLCHRAAH
jgi:hypothetical protein